MTSGESNAAIKSAFMKKLRDRHQKTGKSSVIEVTSGRGGIGNIYAAKNSRRVEIGWLNFENEDYHQVRTRHGGGSRHLTVQKTTTVGEVAWNWQRTVFSSWTFSLTYVISYIIKFLLNAQWMTCMNSLKYECCASTCSKKKEDAPRQSIASVSSSNFDSAEDRPVKVVSPRQLSYKYWSGNPYTLLSWLIGHAITTVSIIF